MEEKLEMYIQQNQIMTATQESNPLARFVHHHVLELARECLEQERDKQFTRAHSIALTNKLQQLLTDVKEWNEFVFYAVYTLIKKLKIMLIISRAHRVLESQEIGPEAVDVAEGEAKQTSKVDTSQDIISELGQSRAPVTDGGDSVKDCDVNDVPEVEEYMLCQNMQKGRKLCEVDFETTKLISNGAYAAVYLVQHMEVGQKFAMKKICIQEVIKRDQTEQVFTERDILAFIDNPFVVSMYCSFNTKKHLCMAMEYVEGRDCETLLKNIEPFASDMASLLITAAGHIKLTDFGLSKLGRMSLRRKLCEGLLDKDCKQFMDKRVLGTPAYIAPEVMLKEGYGKPVDWWSMGIMSYEFFVGVPPFFGEDLEDLFTQIINETDIELPEVEEWAVRDDAKDLITSLLQHNPLNRLRGGGAQEVKEHFFFTGIEWEGLLRKKPAFVPELEDTSYFDTRVDRYRHDRGTESTEDDADENIFHGFSYSLPSKVYSNIEELQERSEVDEPINEMPCTENEKNDFTEANQKIEKSEKRPRRLWSWVCNLKNVFTCCVGLNKVRSD